MSACILSLDRPAAKLFDEGKLAIVQGVGYPNPDQSHFRSMDIWHSAQPLNEKPARDGWLGRALEWQFDRQSALAAIRN